MSACRILIIGCLAMFAFIPLSSATSSDFFNTSPRIFAHTPELKASPQFRLAKATFLPETFNDLGLSEFKRSKYDYNSKPNCSSYILNNCPDNGSCANCPFNQRLKKLISCKIGFTKINNFCKPNSCQAINTSYFSDIPNDYICSQTLELGLICYKNCQLIDCASYPLNCTASIPNALSLENCPDCLNPHALCSVQKCKVKTCVDGYKVAENAASCIMLDDNCPDGYYKNCQTGTTGEPQYTEKGTACYKCQARTCSNGNLNLNIYWCDGALKCLLPAN